jgi:branched-chain amino acid transport system ATP-binding protein
MSPVLVDEAFHVIRGLRDEGITVLLIEQNVRKSLEIADRAYVLENGRVVLEGDAASLQRDVVDKAYLGL